MKGLTIEQLKVILKECNSNPDLLSSIIDDEEGLGKYVASRFGAALSSSDYETGSQSDPDDVKEDDEGFEEPESEDYVMESDVERGRESGGFDFHGSGLFSGTRLCAAKGVKNGGKDYSKILDDSELLQAFEDSEVMTALNDVMENPANVAVHQANPKVARILAQLKSKFGGPK